MSFEEIIDGRTDGQRTNIDHNSTLCSGELKTMEYNVSLACALSQRKFKRGNSKQSLRRRRHRLNDTYVSLLLLAGLTKLRQKNNATLLALSF